MGLKDYDFPDEDYVDPLENMGARERKHALRQEAKWSSTKTTFWIMALIAAYAWGCILCLLAIFCILTVVLFPLAFILFPLAALPAGKLIEARVRNRVYTS